MKSTDVNYIDLKAAQKEFDLHPSTIKRYLQDLLITDAFRLGMHGKWYISRQAIRDLLCSPKEKANG